MPRTFNQVIWRTLHSRYIDSCVATGWSPLTFDEFMKRVTPDENRPRWRNFEDESPLQTTVRQVTEPDATS